MAGKNYRGRVELRKLFAKKMNRDMCCEDYIKQTIRDNGPVSFRDYMNLCLYDPQCGYYTNPETSIGANGDFYTSPCVTPLFGEMIAKQIEEMWTLMNRQFFSIVEFGGAKGKLCSHILNYLTGNKKLYKNLQYYIIDPSVQRTPPFIHEKVKWMRDSTGLDKIDGCILSNELVDNLPVHRIVMKEKLMEIFVDADKDGFHEVLMPAEATVLDYLKECGVRLSYDFNTEVNLDALEWITDAANILNEGFIITIDYGFSKEELYSEQRRTGTITCYYRHLVNYNPYIHAGEQDITAHINFSALVTWGKRKQLDFTGYTNQQYFLRSLGLAPHIRVTEQNSKNVSIDAKRNYALYHFLAEFSNKMKVLIQQKGIPKMNLRGLSLGINNPVQAGLL